MNPIHSSIKTEAKHNLSLLRILLSELNTRNQTSLQNPEHSNDKQGQLNRFHEKSAASPIEHLHTSTPSPAACLRTPALCLMDCLRTSALCLMDFLHTSAPSALLGLRISAHVALLGLRISALFLQCTCGPTGIDNFQTSKITQTIRSRDLIMRQEDLNPLVDPTCNPHVSP